MNKSYMSLFLLSCICYFSTIKTKSMVYFDNNAGIFIRIHTVNKTDSGTETRTGDRLVEPNTKSVTVLNLDRSIGKQLDESNFSIAFTPQADEILELQKKGSPIDMDDYIWIPIAILYQWSKHGPFGGTIYYNIVYPDEKNNNYRENKRTFTRRRTIVRGNETYTFSIIAQREEPGGGQNDNIRFILSAQITKTPEPVLQSSSATEKPTLPLKE